jgi:predicted ester cyclase
LITPKGTIAATGKRIEFRSCIISELAGDKAKLERQYFDMGTMLQQIGAAN